MDSPPPDDVAEPAPATHWRDRFETRGVALALAFGLSALIVLPALDESPLGTFAAFGLAVVVTTLRRGGWRRLGMGRPARGWLATLALSVPLGVALMLVTTAIVDPLLGRLLGQPVDLSSFESLEGDLPQLLVWLTFVWIVVALLEEILFRGVLFDAFRGAVGRSLIVPAIASSVVFGLAHAYQGPTGIASTAFAGCVLVGLYVRGGGDLWLPILVHGVVDTVALVLLYLGAYGAVEHLFFS